MCTLGWTGNLAHSQWYPCPTPMCVPPSPCQATPANLLSSSKKFILCSASLNYHFLARSRTHSHTPTPTHPLPHTLSSKSRSHDLPTYRGEEKLQSPYLPTHQTHQWHVCTCFSPHEQPVLQLSEWNTGAQNGTLHVPSPRPPSPLPSFHSVRACFALA